MDASKKIGLCRRPFVQVFFLPASALLTFWVLWAGCSMAADPSKTGESLSSPIDADRSPIDLALSPNGRWIVTANQIANSLSVIDAKTRTLVSEIPCGKHPVQVKFTNDGTRVVVSCAWEGRLESFSLDDGKLAGVGSVNVGFEPHGFALTQDASKAFIGLMATGEVAEVDLGTQQLVRRFKVGNWPRYVALSRDEKRLAIGLSGDSQLAVVDVPSGDLLYEEPLTNGINFGEMLTSRDGKYVYLPWMIYRTNPISVDNIRRGWVLASRIARVRLDGPATREAISLDVPGLAVADPHDIAITSNGERLVASAGGTHELLVYRLPDLPFVTEGGPGDLIDRTLQRDRDRFDRIELGGRPTGIAVADDDRTIYVANFLRNSVQLVDIESKVVMDEIKLGGPANQTLARRGMEVFYDGRRSLDQWYSCHTCHYEGGGNSRPMDTLNDGTEMSLKTVLPLYHLTKTGPWTWHGWQTDLEDAMHRSITSTMKGPVPSEEDIRALIAYFDTLSPPPNPFVGPGGNINAAAERGRELFHSARTGCATCHSGEYFTDGETHDVGLGQAKDAYDGFNTPTLIGVHRKVRWLHSGRAKSLERVVTDLHRPDKVAGTQPLTDSEAADLIEYLKSL